MAQIQDIQFINFTPIIQLGFWTTLAKKKIDEWKLDQSKQIITAKYKNGNFADKKSQVTFDAFAFDENQKNNKTGPLDVIVNSHVQNFNTIEEFNNADINALQQSEVQFIIDQIDKFISGELNNLDTTHFLLLTFVDLKKYVHSYTLLTHTLQIENYKLNKKTQLKQAQGFNIEDFDSSLKQYIEDPEQDRFNPIFGFDGKNVVSLQIALKLLSEKKSVYFIYVDPFNKADGYNAFLNNLFALFIRYSEKNENKVDLSNVNILAMKDFIVHKNPKAIDFKNSQLLEVNLQEAKIKYVQNQDKQELDMTGKELQKTRQVNLKEQMDEVEIARNAIDLNVKLMKWRMLPSLNFEQLKETKCLLFGAGTLGCQLSRNLIGWGIQNITFIDYGKVSYSNPVRQSLYDFEDSTNGGQPKAPTAAKKLKKIFPDINAQGYEIQIPMPGHFLNEEQQKKALESTDLIEKLVESHDVLFLMTDTRESRWLPTVLANKYNKACITIGLGFDSYVIVRHGMNSEKHSEQMKLYEQQVQKEKEESKENEGSQQTQQNQAKPIVNDRLACYFCHDILAPSNTMKDRTLDQQCTVTRPGLSFVSAAYASELFISMLSHPLQHESPAHEDKDKLEETELGILPQHIRGSMSDFNTQLFYGKAFSQCIACSNDILKIYNNDRDNLIARISSDSKFLQEVVGIKEYEYNSDDDCGVLEFD